MSFPMDDNLTDERLLGAAYRELAAQAAEIERVAMDLDRAGGAEQAAACYQQAAEKLARAAAACPEANPDRAVLSRHAGEVLGRAVYLESLGGAPAAAGIEEHIGSAQLAPAAAASAAAGAASSPAGEEGAESSARGEAAEEAGALAGAGGEARPASWRQQAASAAAVGGTAGLLVLHAPVVAAVMAAGAAYATTRGDSAGEAARSMGNVGLQAAERARTLAEEKHIPERMENAIGRVRAFDERYGVSERAQTAAATSWQSLRDLDRKHGVSTKVGQGVASASAGAASATAAALSWASRVSARR